MSSPARLEVRPQDLVISLLGAYVRDPRRLVWSGGLVDVLETFGFSRAASRVALARIVRRELLEPVRDGRRVHYALTPKMLDAIREGDRRIFGLGRSRSDDEPWTALWHFIPQERHQDRLHFARRLRFIGFGSPQDGVWIAPHDVEQPVLRLAEELDLVEHCAMLVGVDGDAFDIAVLAHQAWDVAGLARRYAGFAEEFGPLRSVRAQRRLRGPEALHVHMTVAHRFRVFASLDPVLPRRMMPRPEVRDRAIALFDRLYAGLAPAAQACFDAMTAVERGGG